MRDDSNYTKIWPVLGSKHPNEKYLGWKYLNEKIVWMLTLQINKTFEQKHLDIRLELVIWKYMREIGKWSS